MPDGDGINPNISLGIATPAAANPLSQLSGMMDLQGKMNANAQFQQEFGARQIAGQIIAGAKNPEEGMSALLQNPQVAPFAGKIITEYKQGLLANAQYQGEIQKQSQSGLEAVTKAMLAGISDPKMLMPAMKAQLAGLSPEARGRVEPAMNSLASSLLDGLPSDPTEAKKTFVNRQAGIAIAAGHTPAAVQGLIGTPVSRDNGGGLDSGVQLPAQLGGGDKISTVIPKTLAPQKVDVTTSTGASQSLILGGGAAAGGAALPVGGAGGLGLPSMAAGGQGAGPGAPSVNALGGPNPSGVLSTGPSLETKDFSTNRGHDIADYAKNLDSDVSTGAGIMKVVSEARNAQELFHAGGGADMYKKVAQLAQGLGVDPQTVDKIASGNLGSAQEFDKLMNQTTMGQIKQQLPEGSRLAQAEFKTFTEKNPNIETDPRAIEKVFNFWTNIYKQKSDEQASFNKYASTPGPSGQPNSLSAWPTVWNQLQQQKGYVTPEITNKTGADYGPNSQDQIVADYKAGKLTRSQAQGILKLHGYK